MFSLKNFRATLALLDERSLSTHTGVGERMVVVRFPAKTLRKWTDQPHTLQDGLPSLW